MQSSYEIDRSRPGVQHMWLVNVDGSVTTTQPSCPIRREAYASEDILEPQQLLGPLAAPTTRCCHTSFKGGLREGIACRDGYIYSSHVDGTNRLTQYLKTTCSSV
jgi:hypothetical protein